MAVKVTIDQLNPQKEKIFPKVMVHSEDKQTTIVHFNTFGIGVQLYSNAPENEVFQMKETSNWDMDKFTDYNGSVTIQNA